jgi:preprotein translocase subunit SecF
MFQLVSPDINIDFIRLRTACFIFSGLLILVGLGSLVMRGGPNYGIDFAGGVMLHFRVDPSVGTDEIRGAIAASGAGAASVQQFESQPGEFLIRLATADERIGGGVVADLKEQLQSKFGSRRYEDLRTEVVGPQVGKDLRRRAILSVLLATAAMGAYIAFRFDFWFGVGAAVALFHDVLITVGALSLYNVEVDLTVLAALLTVVGYSVNDTVIVSDRIRENMRANKKAPLAKVINASINQTLSRTILTTGTTLLVLFALFYFGGGVIHGFAFTLIVGLLIGTYSSIFIASPIVEAWSGAGPETPVAATSRDR